MRARLSSTMRSERRLRSAGESTPRASRSAGARARKSVVATCADANRVPKRDNPAARSHAVTCTSAILGAWSDREIPLSDHQSDNSVRKRDGIKGREMGKAMGLRR